MLVSFSRKHRTEKSFISLRGKRKRWEEERKRERERKISKLDIRWFRSVPDALVTLVSSLNVMPHTHTQTLKYTCAIVGNPVRSRRVGIGRIYTLCLASHTRPPNLSAALYTRPLASAKLQTCFRSRESWRFTRTRQSPQLRSDAM